MFFRPYRQDARIGAITFYARTALDPSQLLRAIPGVVARLDPNLPVENLKTLPQQVQEHVFLDRMISTLAGAFAALATLLAAIGLYGVLVYTVAQRTREIGLRMALGADGRRVRGMVLAQVWRMTAIGGVIGVALALGLGFYARSLLFGLQEHDPMVVAAAVAALTVVALGAGYIPAMRASTRCMRCGTSDRRRVRGRYVRSRMSDHEVTESTKITKTSSTNSSSWPPCSSCHRDEEIGFETTDSTRAAGAVERSPNAGSHSCRRR